MFRHFADDLHSQSLIGSKHQEVSTNHLGDIKLI